MPRVCIEKTTHSLFHLPMKPWIVTCPMSVPQDEQAFLINFTLINERCLAIRVVHDAKSHMITTEPKVLEIHFDIGVLWITSMFPEHIMLTNQGGTRM